MGSENRKQESEKKNFKTLAGENLWNQHSYNSEIS